MDRDTILSRALTLGEQEDWAGAAELLRDHLSDFEEDPAVHCWLGVAERELGMDGVAYERFKRALALDPSDPYVLATAGNGIAHVDDPDAEQALRAAAVTAPDVAVGRFLYGAYLAREGFLEQGLEELRAARELDPGDHQIAYELGAAYAMAGEHEKATDALADAVRLAPDDGWTRVVFGLELLEEDRMEESAGELLSGARLLEEDVYAQLAAALAAAATERLDEAFEMMERARIRALEGDLALVTGVEERVDSGAEEAARFLTEELAPNMLRLRLSERP
ncbi:MAG: tetratricopeptide repeat protein [Longimicrobiales bacterium]|nr:tetratricopeptide repeat protein [Longimicrobiales bacterium]